MPGRKRRLPIRWNNQKRSNTLDGEIDVSNEAQAEEGGDEVIEIKNDDENQSTEASTSSGTIQEDSGIFEEETNQTELEIDQTNNKSINKCFNIPTLFEEQKFHVDVFKLRNWNRPNEPDKYMTWGQGFYVSKLEVPGDKHMFIGYLKLSHQPDDLPGNAIGNPFAWENQSKVSEPFGVMRCGNRRDISKRHLETYFTLESIYSFQCQTTLKQNSRKAAEEIFSAIAELRNRNMIILDLKYIPDSPSEDKHFILDMYLGNSAFDIEVTDPLDGPVAQGTLKARCAADGFIKLFKHLELCCQKTEPLRNDFKFRNMSTPADLYKYLKSYHAKNEAKYVEELRKMNDSSNNDVIENHQNVVSTNGDVQHTSLLPILYPYQCKAVRWMLCREKMEPSANDVNVIWKKLKTIDGKEFYFNPTVGRLSRECPTITSSPTGGILADEMGLGKTIEVLACLLNNPKPSTKPVTATANEASEITDNKIATDETSECITRIHNESTTSPDEAKAFQPDDAKINVPESNLVEEGKIIADHSKEDTVMKSKEPDDMSLKEDKSSIVEGVLEKEQKLCSEDVIAADHSYSSVLVNPNKSNDALQKEILSQKIDENVGTEPNVGNKNTTDSSHSQTDVIMIPDDEPESKLLESAGKSRQPELKQEVSRRKTKEKPQPTKIVKPVDDASINVCRICANLKSRNAKDCLLYCTECSRGIHKYCCGLMNYEDVEAKCPQCASKEMIESHATLIVAPAAIVHQWTDEIKKHIRGNSLKVKVYHGVSREYVQPSVLARYDIVITTYQTLRADLHYVLANEAKRKLRGQRKYIILPSPLTSIEFWRLCFDEAQMVEDQTSRTAEMAFKINAIHRWCVTGTPLPSGLNSTLGLFSNIGLFPYFRRYWWSHLLMTPAHWGNPQPLFDAIKDYMWRLSMDDVCDQINIPQQNEVVHWVSFGPAEQHMYFRELEQLSQSVFKVLRHHSSSSTLNNIHRQTLPKIMNPLLRLRQACCHPQIVSGNTLGAGKKLVTMDTLIDGLINKTRIECIETHRQIIANYNGMAGIFQLLEKYEDAVKCYRSAIASWESRTDLATDSIQKIHTLYNLRQLLESDHDNCKALATEASLASQVATLREGYILKANEECQDSYMNYADMLLATAEAKDKVDFTDTPWYFTIIDKCIRAGLDTSLDLYNRVLETIPEKQARDSGGRFKKWLRDFNSVKNAVMATMRELEDKRSETIKSFKSMYTTLPPHIVDSVAECCLRPQNGIPQRSCQICLLETQLSEYEAYVYNIGINEESASGTIGGLRPESACNRVVRFLQGLTRHLQVNPELDEIQQQSKLHIKYFEQIKKEFKVFRESWIALRARIAAYDELDMCTIKMRLRQSNEMETNDANVFTKNELQPNLISLEHNGTALLEELRSRSGHLTYLKNLSKSESTNAKNEEPCPICCIELGSQWSVFECGHCVCTNCSLMLKRESTRHSRRTIRCPICRGVTYYHKLYRVASRKQVQYQGDGIEVKGNYSAKIDAVLRSALGIIRDDCTAKMVIFSAWESILKLLVPALTKHDINHRYTVGGIQKFNLAVDEFRADPSISVLLMPLLQGSKGLNLIEANHVLLVEPSLNPSNEQQAIGRIHRIGQTRSTWVHRFFIRGTVEERLFKILPSKSDTTSDQDVNYKLTVAEIGSLFAQSNEDEE